MEPLKLGLVPHRKDQSDIDSFPVVAAAIQDQLVEVARCWHTPPILIHAFHQLEDLDRDVWPIVVTQQSGTTPGRHFAHDSEQRPFAFVRQYGDWPRIASHEAIEMAIDPVGQRTIAGPSLEDGDETVDYLVEPCDPCQRCSYLGGSDVPLSNFCTPDFYGRPAIGFFDRARRITRPLQLLEGGYATWKRRADDHWLQGVLMNGYLQVTDLGPLVDAGMSTRTQVDLTPAGAEVTPGGETWRHTASRLRARKQRAHQLRGVVRGFRSLRRKKGR